MFISSALFYVLVSWLSESIFYGVPHCIYGIKIYAFVKRSSQQKRILADRLFYMKEIARPVLMLLLLLKVQPCKHKSLSVSSLTHGDNILRIVHSCILKLFFLLVILFVKAFCLFVSNRVQSLYMWFPSQSSVGLVVKKIADEFRKSFTDISSIAVNCTCKHNKQLWKDY